MKRTTLWSAGLLIALALPWSARAQSASTGSGQAYPNKPVRIVVPYVPGGAVDIVARAVAQELTKRLGQTVLVDNRTGAGGNIGADVVAKSAPDGYTLLMASPANTINPSLYTKMPYEPMRDLVTVALIGSVPTVLIASRALPVQNVKQIVTLAKAQPGALTYGSDGSGTTEHLAGEMFKSVAQVDILHVREIVAALSSPEMKERLKTLSAKPIGGTPEEFARFFAEETKRRAQVVKASGARVDQIGARSEFQ